jgi:ATP-binding cassette subfamily F protein 3
MLMYPSNFLLLDEPTNHLDLRAKDVLLEALEKFAGTVVFVSHDRYFIDKLASKIFEVAEQTVTVFPGNYEDFRWRKQQQGTDIPSAAKAGKSAGHNGAAPATSLGTGSAAPLQSETTEAAEVSKKRLNPIKLRQMQERQQELEEQVSRVEAEIAQCENGLQTFVSAEETARLSELLERRRRELEPLVAEWEALSVVLESNP